MATPTGSRDDLPLAKVHSLSDLELAILLSLVAREHCIISTPSASVSALVSELSLVASRTFGLQSAVVTCHATTTLEDFAAGLLLPPSQVSPASAATPHTSSRRRGGDLASPSYFAPLPGARAPSNAGAAAGGRIADVVIAPHLDLAPPAVQIQALELLRSRRIYSRTAAHAAPKTFLFVAVVADRPGGRLTPHLNDYFYLAHWHDPEDGFVNLDEEDGREEERRGGDDDDGAASTASGSSVVVRTGARDRPASAPPLLSEAELALLAQLTRQVSVDVDVVRYEANIVSFLRMHRAAAPGSASPAATKHFQQLSRSLAPLHGLDYVTPSLVALAARKAYLHRVRIVAPERERSIQWGSDLAAVEALLDGVEAEDVIEDVLEAVAAPV